jgi:hypothetical protein
VQPTARTSTHPNEASPDTTSRLPGSRSRPATPQFVNRCGDWLRPVIKHSFQRLQFLLFHNRIRASAHTGLVGAALGGSALVDVHRVQTRAAPASGDSGVVTVTRGM